MSIFQLTAALYARGCPEREGRGFDAAAWADGLTPRPQLADEGYSGSSFARPALNRLRGAAAAGSIDRLYVRCPDRLARDLPHRSLLIDELRRASVAVVFLGHNLGDSPAIVALAVRCPDPAEEPTPRHSSLAPSDQRRVVS